MKEAEDNQSRRSRRSYGSFDADNMPEFLILRTRLRSSLMDDLIVVLYTIRTWETEGRNSFVYLFDIFARLRDACSRIADVNVDKYFPGDITHDAPSDQESPLWDHYGSLRSKVSQYERVDTDDLSRQDQAIFALNLYFARMMKYTTSKLMYDACRGGGSVSMESGQPCASLAPDMLDELVTLARSDDVQEDGYEISNELRGLNELSLEVHELMTELEQGKCSTINIPVRRNLNAVELEPLLLRLSQAEDTYRKHQESASLTFLNSVSVIELAKPQFEAFRKNVSLLQSSFGIVVESSMKLCQGGNKTADAELGKFFCDHIRELRADRRRLVHIRGADQAIDDVICDAICDIDSALDETHRLLDCCQNDSVSETSSVGFDHELHRTEPGGVDPSGYPENDASRFDPRMFQWIEISPSLDDMKIKTLRRTYSQEKRRWRQLTSTNYSLLDTMRASGVGAEDFEFVKQGRTDVMIAFIRMRQTLESLCIEGQYPSSEYFDIFRDMISSIDGEIGLLRLISGADTKRDIVALGTNREVIKKLWNDSTNHEWPEDAATSTASGSV